MPHNLYLLEEKDIPEVLPLLRKFQEEFSPWDDFEDEVVSKNLSLLCFQNEGILLAAVSNDVVVGVLAATRNQSLFSYKIQTQELAFFVDPEFRKTTIGKDLWSVYDAWSKTSDFTTAHCIDQRVGKLYERKGFTRAEIGYFRRNR